MELLSKNHPRFCAKYLSAVGEVETPRNRRFPIVKVGEMLFEESRCSSSEFKPGDVAYIAKRLPTLRREQNRWMIHKIILAEAHWLYMANCRRSPKEQRSQPYPARAQTWFGSNTRLLIRIR